MSSIQKIGSSLQKQYILALNAGSSSLKASLMEHDSLEVAQKVFLAERLNTPDGIIHLPSEKSITENNLSHEKALKHIIDYLKGEHLLDFLIAIGHRVVHGGTSFTSSVVVKDAELQLIKNVSHLAPLHNPHNVAGIETMQKLLKEQNIPNVAVFDTAFHSSIPPVAYNYPIPLEYRKEQIRKYGFHGTSVHYVTLEADRLLSKLKHTTDSTSAPEDGFHLIVCHLGNGASVTAVSHGKSMDTSMGFTPLSGLMMGTRSGSIDPSIIDFACSTLNKTVEQVTVDLNKNSGLKAMTANGDSDMRSLLKARTEGDPQATLAVDMFVYRLTQHIASSMIALKGPVDAIVFTAGIGENSAEIRRLACDQIHQSLLPQLALDAQRNAANGKDSDGIVSQEGAWPVILTIPTNEEKMIAKECLRLVGVDPSSSD